MRLTSSDTYEIVDPQDNRRVIQSFTNYDDAMHWLMEDEYSLVEGRYYADEFPLQLDEFVSNFLVEVHSPLNRAKGFSQLIKKKIASIDYQQEDLHHDMDQIIKAVDELETLMKNLDEGRRSPR